MTSEHESRPRSHEISQGHPTGSDPNPDKGGQAGGAGLDEDPSNRPPVPPMGGADAGATPDDPGRGGD